MVLARQVLDCLEVTMSFNDSTQLCNSLIFSKARRYIPKSIIKSSNMASSTLRGLEGHIIVFPELAPKEHLLLPDA